MERKVSFIFVLCFSALFLIFGSRRMSKYTHILALKHPYTAKSVAEIYVKEIVRLHGYPKSIVSDRDKVFLSNIWKEMFRLSRMG